MRRTASCRFCGRDFLPVNNRQQYCSRECRWKATHRGTRHSGRVYQNTPERLSEIREKYRNGVTEDILREWMEAL